MKTYEANFDGLVGPTHNYSGLAYGNVASLAHAGEVSSPREAARQGLRKMKALYDMGLKQGVLAPQERPDVHALRRLGFSGVDHEIIAKAARQAPKVFAACCSAASMWSANAATVAPSADTADGKVHFTPANLCSTFHRSLEPETTARILRAMFDEPGCFRHHAPLPGVAQLSDEGAANHTRLCGEYGAPGVHLFVYGKVAFDPAASAPARFPARQALEASQAVCRLHGLDAARVVLAQQHPRAVAAGVFHNDVIAVGNQNVLLCHERAFVAQARVLAELREKLAPLPLRVHEVESGRVSVEAAVASYLFNSQLITRPGGEMALIVPRECREEPTVWAYLQELTQSGAAIREVIVLDLRQSMRNGGGPACLRLRVVLTEAELSAMNAGVLLNDALYAALNAWVDRHYRDRLTAAELADPRLLDESRTALDELSRILNLGSVYPFQLAGA